MGIYHKEMLMVLNKHMYKRMFNVLHLCWGAIGNKTKIHQKRTD
jgi:hypothetical protein